MRNQEWAAPWKQLQDAGLGNWPADKAIASMRADVYRDALDDLKPAAWAHAALEAVKHEEFYPTVAKLREYAATYREPQPGEAPANRKLPAATPEQVEAFKLAEHERRKTGFAGGLAKIAEALREQGHAVPSEVVRSMPAATPRLRIVAPQMSDEDRARRLALLSEQARAITGNDKQSA